MPKHRAQSVSSKRMVRLVLLLVALAGGVSLWLFQSRSGADKGRVIIPTNALELLIQFEEAEAQKYWAPELAAQERGRVIERLWDEINQAGNKLGQFVSAFHADQVITPEYDQPRLAPHGIHIFSPVAAQTLGQPAFGEWIGQLQASGWILERCEFRHIGIAPDRFYISGHLTKADTQERAILEGEVGLEFGPSGDHPIRRVDASKLELRLRRGPPGFTEIFHAEVPPPSGSYFIDPLIVWDLDWDGQVEVILAAANVVIRRESTGRWRPDVLIDPAPNLTFGGILGDFTGNGVTDFLGLNFDGAILFSGAPDGRFVPEGRRAWTAQLRLKYAQCFTAGDIDGDGDLDLFLGQYKVPYEKGQMPFPYFDANDGYPFYLLINDGNGDFADGTQRAGLSAKRARRVYSASLVDLDADGDLDLVLVSDFSGLDVFTNEGNGKFTDATAKWFADRHGFGMAHCFADFNGDGRLDLLMIGMNSPTADRLASAKLSRPYETDDSGKRDAVAFGNRLYFGLPDGSFTQTKLSGQVSRTGWSWGAAAADLDNDGFPDLYIANGHATQESVREYEPEFWLHDIYIGTSQENSLAEQYFRQKFARTRGKGHSYGGYERNRLFWNEGGTNFVEAAHLFGLAIEQDARNVAAQDLDNDGRLDLIVTTFESYPEARQTIRFFRNELDQSGGSVKVQLADQRRVGAAGQIRWGRTNAFAIVSGESYRTQLPPIAHFGIGSNDLSTVHLLDDGLFRLTPNPSP